MTAANDAPLLMDSLEAAAYLSVSRSWLNQAVKAKRIDVIRFGAKVRFTKSALDDFILASTVPAAPAPQMVPGRRPTLHERKVAAGLR
jgi:excisionase family DNA binding protein